MPTIGIILTNITALLGSSNFPPSTYNKNPITVENIAK